MPRARCVSIHPHAIRTLYFTIPLQSLRALLGSIRPPIQTKEGIEDFYETMVAVLKQSALPWRFYYDLRNTASLDRPKGERVPEDFREQVKGVIDVLRAFADSLGPIHGAVSALLNALEEK